MYIPNFLHYMHLPKLYTQARYDIRSIFSTVYHFIMASVSLGICTWILARGRARLYRSLAVAMQNFSLFLTIMLFQSWARWYTAWHHYHCMSCQNEAENNVCLRDSTILLWIHYFSTWLLQSLLAYVTKTNSTRPRV